MLEFENMLHDEFIEPPFKIMVYTVIFLFGICIGSFLNVVILRIPKHESILGIGRSKEEKEEASHCMTCGAKIRPIDLIPVFSWIFLRGKCHSCGAKISCRYPIVESLNGIMYVLTFWVLDLNAKAIITCVVMSLLIVVGFMDWDTMEIDMIIVGIIFLLAIPAALLTDEIEIKQRIIGAAVISLPFFIIGEISRGFIKKKYGEDFRAIELGDTILMIAAGAFLGTQAVIVSAFLGVIFAAFGGLIYKKVTGESKFAFGPFLSMGIAIAALWGNDIAQWYINTLTQK